MLLSDSLEELVDERLFAANGVFKPSSVPSSLQISKKDDGVGVLTKFGTTSIFLTLTAEEARYLGGCLIEASESV